MFQTWVIVLPPQQLCSSKIPNCFLRYLKPMRRPNSCCNYIVYRHNPLSEETSLTLTNNRPKIMDQCAETTTNKEERNYEVLAGEDFSLTRGEHKSSSLTNIESLPDELVFDILVRLPTEDIVKQAILVCRKWHRIVHTHGFRHAQVPHSTTGLFIQRPVHRNEAVFVAMRQGQKIQVSKYNFEFNGVVWSSCNGLIVESDVINTDPIYITNPATNQRFSLPTMSRPIKPFRRALIAYAAASMQYKVVLTPYEVPDIDKPYCAILTVGVDQSWRIVDTNHLSLPSGGELFGGFPLCTEGFIHWTSPINTRVVTLNVETEILTQSEIPIPQQGRGYYISSGSSLTLLIECGDLSWEVWNTKPEKGEWTKLRKIDLDDREHKSEHLLRGNANGFSYIRPFGWLNEEVLVFSTCSSKVCLLYNVRTREIDFLHLNFSPFHISFKVHRNTLCWF